MMIRRLGIVVALFGVVGLIRADVKRETSLSRMQADMQYFTSDECEGRGPGTVGIDKAADRISAAFKEAGLKGAMKDGGYFQPFTVGGPSRLTKSELSIWGSNGIAIKLMAGDFTPLGQSASGTVSGELVFVGHSVIDNKVPYDDYEGLDVAGKVVVMLRRCPRYAVTGEKKFGDGDSTINASALTTKIANAEKHKAAAVILVNDRTTLTESKDALMPFTATRSANAAKIPAVHIHRDVAELMFRRSFGKSVEQIEDAIDKELKPQNGPMKGLTADFDVAVERDRKVQVKNVVGVLEGSGPLANETVIVGAHYDHLGYGGFGSLARGLNKPMIHYGADDNASGTTTIVELARRFGAQKDRVGRRIVFMTFSAEEMGLLGSVHYCKEPLFPLENTSVMVNLDMVGRMIADKETNLDKLEIGGMGTATQFDEMVDKYNQKYNFKLKKTKAGMGPSDHQSFFLKQLPVLFFFTGLHTDYHRPTDTWEKINYVGMLKIADMVEELVVDLAAREEKLEFVKVSGSMMPTQQEPRPKPAAKDATESKPAPKEAKANPQKVAPKEAKPDPHGDPPTGQQQIRMKVRVGAIPDYSDDDKDGVLLQGVSPDSPASKAGLKEGDRVLEIAGDPVKNLTAYMALLGKLTPGKPVEYVILRKDKKMTIKITPEKPAQEAPKE